jgi:hypothetical protein
MKRDPFVRIFLVAIAAFLGWIALGPLIAEKVEAQAHPKHDFYIEPGTTTVRAPDGSTQVIGKVIVDLRNGKVWGFPTPGPQPYPMDPTKPEPPVSHPVYLGQHDFSATNR